MATNQLDFIATTPVARRKYVMPRIHCKDGVSLSIQTSDEHFSEPSSSTGPWTELKVAFFDGIHVPNDWRTAMTGDPPISKHDCAGISPWGVRVSVYVASVENLRAFIESHGGEAEDDAVENLQAQVETFRAEESRKWAELEAAQAKERAIWDGQIKATLARVPDEIDQVEANQIVLEKLKGEYDAAFKEVNRLFDEWAALAKLSNELSNRCHEAINQRIELVNSGHY